MLTLTISQSNAADKVTEYDNMPAALRYLDRFAARRGWFFSRNRIDARNWHGKFSDDAGRHVHIVGTYSITK